MKVNLKQGTPEWHEWRSGGLGGSEACIIMNCSPFNTRRELFLVKTGRKEAEPFSEWLSRMGAIKEIVGRDDLSEKYGDVFVPACYQHDELPFIRASLDGINYSGDTLCECKFVGDDMFKLVTEKQFIPDYHHWQMAQGFLASNATRGVYVVIGRYNQVGFVEIERDDDMCTTLREAIVDYWQLIEKGTEPELTEKDTLDMEGNNEFLSLMLGYKKCAAEIKSITAQQDEIKTQLEALAGSHSAASVAGKVTRFKVRGRIKDKEVYAAYDIADEQLDDFRADESVQYRITPAKSLEI